MFENATRKQYRYPSIKGELTTEQLWQLPLQANSGFDLDSVAQAINRQLKSASEESFVTEQPKGSDELDEKLSIVVHIIGVKKAEKRRVAEQAERARERARLTEILHIRTQDELMKLDPAELQKRIDALGSD